ncbi:hypothetical protein FKW77_001786 [Venturia effusa]|uniref:N-acetyltransferase domain-containing protein n=1 Tax=Venturia effusa TaxID=50376 RepID=A0A517LD94_9PEZI|nr:hypothetical protein FKW77_001786 [Venturia effusa]
MRGPFESKRLIFRACKPEDASWYYSEIIGDVETRLFSFADRLMRPTSGTEGTQQIKELLSYSLLGVVICAPVAANSPVGPVRVEYQQIGIVQLTNEAENPVQRHNRKTKLIVHITKSARGCGYGTEATNWALNWAFQIAGMHRVAVSTMGYNRRVLGWLRRVGFVEEGREREGCWWNGAWHDIVTLSMLEGEWRSFKDGTKKRNVESMSEGMEGMEIQ